VTSTTWVPELARRLGDAADEMIAAFPHTGNPGKDAEAQQRAPAEAHEALDRYEEAAPSARFVAADTLAQALRALFDWANGPRRSDRAEGGFAWVVFHMAVIQFRDRVVAGRDPHEAPREPR